MGGMSTWELAAEHPECFAAIALVAAHHKEEKRTSIARRLRSMPIYAIHDREDRTCELDKEKALWNLFDVGMVNVRITEGRDHCLMHLTAYCESNELYRWFLSHRLKTVAGHDVHP